MSHRSGSLQLEFLQELIDANVIVAGNVVRVGVTTWAIHASIPVDGSVLVAEYNSLEEASEALRQLGPNSTIRSDHRAAARSVTVHRRAGPRSGSRPS
jgi:hypothetical protein